MAQRAAAALAQQVEAAKRLTPVVKSAWRQFLETNAQYVDKEAPPSMLAKRLLFTSLATAEKEFPVRYAHLRAEVGEVRAAAHNWRELKVATVARGGLFAAECFAWFCVGEIVGRGFKLTGYDY